MAPSPPPRDWLTIAEAAARLQVSPNAVHSAIRRGALPAERLAPRRGRRPQWYIQPQDLDTYAASRSAHARSPLRLGLGSLSPHTQARTVGWTRQRPGSHRVYEALTPVACGLCQRQIQPGEWFTRRAPKVSVCRTCGPFAGLIEDGG
jgi:hypothetical protein